MIPQMQMKPVGKATGIIVSGGVAMKPRTIFRGVKRSACSNCGGAWWELDKPRPEVTAPAYLCTCDQGWRGTTTDLGVMADSGPRRAIPRLFWLAGQKIASATDSIQKRFGR